MKCAALKTIDSFSTMTRYVCDNSHPLLPTSMLANKSSYTKLEISIFFAASSANDNLFPSLFPEHYVGNQFRLGRKTRLPIHREDDIAFIHSRILGASMLAIPAQMFNLKPCRIRGQASRLSLL